MAVTRAKVGDLLDMTSQILNREVRLAADENDLLSKAEEAAAQSPIKEAAAHVRAELGPGARVTTAALDAHLASQVKALIEGENQPAGVGRSFASKAEVKAANKKDPVLGQRVLKAWEIVTGRSADTDGIAETYVRGLAKDSETNFRMFASMEAAENFRDPRGRQHTWLVKTGESSYVWGRNDLWAQRFDIDRSTGERHVTAEH